MNAVQLIGRLYDPECEMKLFYEGYGNKIPKLHFTICCDRPNNKGASTLSYIGCCIGGDAARWFVNHVSHGDVVALCGFLDSRVIRFTNKKDKAELRVVVTQLNWIGQQKKKRLVAGTEKVDLAGADEQKMQVAPIENMTTVNVPEEDDDGQYDTLPEWGGSFYQ